MWLNELGSWIT